jgi:glycosyltransferase involved in cell wall biosynthesis
VDVERFTPVSLAERRELRRNLHLPDAPLIMFVGRLTVAKGLDILLNAWAQRDAALADARLVLVGDGELRERLKQQAHSLGLDRSVIFTGSTTDTAQYLRAADAFVLPSRTEGMPVALLEAMACGLPCIATRVGGSAELIDDGQNGRLIAPEDVAALVQALPEALSMPAWGERARQRIVERYAMDAIAQKYIKLYEATLAHSRSLMAHDGTV